MSARRLTAAQLPDLARGAAILGSGGGGDPYVGRLIAEQALAGGDIELVAVPDLPEDAEVYPVACVGAPSVMVEKIPSVEQLAAPVAALARHRGRPATHIACIEIGGLNSTIPIAVAALMGLPLVDADAMGRAFPELPMTLPVLDGASGSPLALTDEKGNTAIFDAAGLEWTERLTRAAVVEMGGAVSLSNFALTGEALKRSFVRDSVSAAIRLGAVAAGAVRERADPVDAVVAALGGIRIMEGKVHDIERRVVGGFTRGRARLRGVGADESRELVVSFQNENLLAELDGDPVAVTPDLVIVLDADTGEAVPAETLAYGQRASVIAAPADARWHTARGLELVGPAHFGYDVAPRRLTATTARPEENA